MPGLVPGIHVFASTSKDVDGRDKPGHDEKWVIFGEVEVAHGNAASLFLGLYGRASEIAFLRIRDNSSTE